MMRQFSFCVYLWSQQPNGKRPLLVKLLCLVLSLQLWCPLQELCRVAEWLIWLYVIAEWPRGGSRCMLFDRPPQSRLESGCQPVFTGLLLYYLWKQLGCGACCEVFCGDFFYKTNYYVKYSFFSKMKNRNRKRNSKKSSYFLHIFQVVQASSQDI